MRLRLKKVTRQVKKHVSTLFQPKTQQILALGVGSLFVVGAVYSLSHHQIRPSAYRPLLELIARGESQGNYNAFYGNVANTNTPQLTGMTIQEIMNWQREYISQGAASSAVGRYQIIDSTLTSVVKQEKVDVNQRFDEITQDRLAIALINRRGAEEFVRGRISREQFAEQLSQEWAALPLLSGQNAGQSFYAGDGLNHSRIATGDFVAALEQFYQLAK